ncbi:MAG: small multi-drug export protein [Clostridia bacterium]|nr:small multi-drug export protein [Clostridia bacterium]
MDSVAQSLTQSLSAVGVPSWLVVMLISMIPLLELRGSILVAGILLKMKFLVTYISAVIGNMIPIPFILLFITTIFNWMKKMPFVNKFPDWCEKKALKHSEQIEKYGYFGLYLFVAIPLPGTGAWTGSLLAVLFGLDFKKSLLSIFLGVMTAGCVMSVIAFGVNGLISLF